MKFNQISRVTNKEFRDNWVAETLEKLKDKSSPSSLLDAGAGESPYKDVALKCGYAYESQDFNKYSPKETEIGFQDPSWNYPEHTYICDILDIPENKEYDLVLCTEVFEHIPDPVETFKKLVRLTARGGYIVITVPLASHIHQAPYYFSSGLSPQWFSYWSKATGISIESLEIQGDYLDRMKQDLSTMLNFKKPFFIPGLAKITSSLLGLFRPLVASDVLESTGFGTLFIGKKI